jgi:magnesium transporter
MEVCWVGGSGVKAVAEDEVREVVAASDGIVWIHLHHAEERGMALLAELIQARPRDLEDCHARTPVPKLNAYSDHYFTAMSGLIPGSDGRLHFLPMKIFLMPRLLFTVFGPHNAAITSESLRRDVDVVRQRLEDLDLRPETAYDIVAAIRTELLRAHEELVTARAARIGQLELNVMQLDAIKTEALLGELFGLRHDLQTIRTNAAQTYEMLVYLTDQLSGQQGQQGIMQLDPRRVSQLRQGYRHLQNLTDLEREYLQEVLDLFQTRVSTELNRFVRKITAFGTIGIAWTIIIGIYGMNFANMPELTWHYGYAWAVSLMVITGAVLGALFRRHGWL